MAYDKTQLPDKIASSIVTDAVEWKKINLNNNSQDFYQHSIGGNYNKLTWADNNEPTITAKRLQLFEDVAMMFTNISDLNDTADILSIIEHINSEFQQRVTDINKLLTALNNVISAYNNAITHLNTLISNNTGAIAAAQTAIDTHIADKENPHEVTKAQVGLGEVDNKSTATIKTEFTGAVENGNEGFVTGDAVARSITNLSEGQVKANKEALEVVSEQLDNKFESFDILVCERF